MRVWAIVPVKPFARAKSRLAPMLATEERGQFAEHMLGRVLAVLVEHPALAGTVVVSRDPAGLEARLDRRVPILPETGQGLNTAVRQATDWARGRHAEAVLVLPADVPLVTSEDIDAVVELAREEACSVIVPCRREEGTNALLVRPAGAMTYSFGRGSFSRHCRSARARGLVVHIYRSPSLMLDVDRPEDLADYARLIGIEPAQILTSSTLSGTISFSNRP